METPLFPLFLKLSGRRVLVVGGGPVARTRVFQLLEAGALVTVVAPEVRPEIAAAAAEVQLRPFSPRDLDGVWLAVAAATPEVNREVARAAEARRVFLNAVDEPSRCSAYTGGVVRKGGTVVALSSEGRAPALAGLLREALEALLPEELDRWVEEAARLRLEHRQAGVPLADRRPLLLQALNRLYAAPSRVTAPAQAQAREVA
jgi:uroporphyrin-III C-methyltransferase/precorrin-2 dehydrogenase/sirohydrochlorin ferrochelatase